MNPQYQDLYRRDQQRLAAWPPKFRGEGPFLPTGRRRQGRLRYAFLAVATMVALVSAAGVQWQAGGADRGAKSHQVSLGTATGTANIGK